MNMPFIAGHSKIVIGTCQQNIARAWGLRSWMESGSARVFAGRSQVAVGQAQQIIKQCLARQTAA